MGGNVAGAATSNAAGGGQALTNFLNAGSAEPTVTPNTIASQMSPYMNQYVSMALAPQLAAAQNQQSLNMQQMQGAATSAGAFGDPRANLLQTNQQLVNNLSNQGLIGNAYNSAFNTAIGAGAQDVANNLNAQTTNAGLYNTGLQNLLAGSNTAFNQGTGGTNLLNQLGAQQTAQSQAGLNAAYNQWLMGQQYPFQTTQLMNQTLGAASVGAPSVTNATGTSTTTQPNNALGGILGSLVGAGANALPGILSGAGASAAGAGAAAGADPAALAMLALADGGDPPVGRPSLVGERGPELFVPHQNGTVIPFEKIRSAVKAAEKEKPEKRPHELARALGIDPDAKPALPSPGGFSPNLFGQAA